MKRTLCLCILIASFASVRADVSAPVASSTALDKVVEETPLKTQSTAIFAGFGGRQESWYGYAGGIYAFNRNLNSNGVLAKVFVGGGQYEYSTSAVQGGDITGSIVDVTLSLGYKFYLNKDWSVSAFVGPDYRVRDVNALDPGSDTTDSDHIGVQVDLDTTAYTGNIYWNALGNYSSIDDAVFARGRVGYAFDCCPVTIGPEVGYLRDEDYDDIRGGLFLKWQVNESLGLTFAGGYSGYESRGGNQNDRNDSVYGDIGFVVAF